jgi:hypothetical protein
MTTLPSDVDVARQLVSVRASVIEATRHVRSPKRSTRYRTTRNLIIAGAAIAALTAGAIIVLQEQAGIVDAYAKCYPTASLDSEPQWVIGEHGDSEDPVQLCSFFWTNDFWPGSTEQPATDGDLPVPPLVACTSPDGIVAVFPREGSEESDEDFCGALGLADWDSD